MNNARAQVGCHIFQLLMTATFLATFLVILWTYGIYPLILQFLSRLYGKPVRKGNYSPRITIIIATYNEEKVIEGKILNTLALKYSGGLEIIVVDSGSSDKTAQIAKMFDKVKLIEERQRRGKTHALNIALKEATGDIVVITDAACFSNSKDLLTRIAQNFFDKTVGAVAIPLPVKSNWKTDSDYWKRERKLWLNESLLDSVPTGIGEYFAFRKELIESLNPKCLADDLDISIQVRMKGYRIVSEPEAIICESLPAEYENFFNQKVRRIVNVITTLSCYKSVFFNPKYGWYGAMILPSTRLFPILMPVFLFLGFLSLFFLNFYMLLTLLAALIVLAFTSSSFRSFLFSQFVTVVAWIKYIFKDYKPAWQKNPR